MSRFLVAMFVRGNNRCSGFNVGVGMALPGQ